MPNGIKIVVAIIFSLYTHFNIVQRRFIVFPVLCWPKCIVSFVFTLHSSDCKSWLW